MPARPALPPTQVYGSEDGGLTDAARTLVGLLRERPGPGATITEELQARGCRALGCSCLPACALLLSTPIASAAVDAASTDAALREPTRVLVHMPACLSLPACAPTLPLFSMQGCGHIPMDERPAQLNSLLSSFVRRHVLRQEQQQQDGAGQQQEG